MKRLPSFDGWRAISILLVLGDHLVFFSSYVTGSMWLLLLKIFDGNLGVRCFFTISGFLITWLLLREEKANGRISLKNFYARRALRILPVYFACLGALALLQWTGLWTKGIDWFKLFTFTRNFYQSDAENISGHLWSLSVEEQFYFIWPSILLLLGGRSRIYFLGSISLFCIAFNTVALLGFYNRHLEFLFGIFSTFHYLDCLAYGCLGAILFIEKPAQLKMFFNCYSLPIFALAAFLLIGPWIVGLGRGLQSFAFIFLLLQSVLLPELPVFRILNQRWLMRLGIWSYSIYVWQQMIFILWPWPHLWFLELPLTILVGAISYRLIEKPFLFLRRTLAIN